MVYRVYVEKKPELANEARALAADLASLLGIRTEGVRILNRYDVEHITPEVFREAVDRVFSEPQLDLVSDSFDARGARVFAVEYLPGQFDQRADSAAQCIQILSQGERPLVRSAKVYLLAGSLTDEEFAAVKKYVINPVEAREAALDVPETLVGDYERPGAVAVLDGFRTLDEAGLAEFLARLGLAMDLDDLRFCQAYFREEERDPTLTEIRMIDTYWSDHCRHTTFLTTIDSVRFEDPLLQKTYEEYLAARGEVGRRGAVNLMDLATIGARVLKARGELRNLDESEEINACTVKMTVRVDGKEEPWLLLFKN